MTEINELCRDIQMKLPDEIWMLDSLERYRRGASIPMTLPEWTAAPIFSAWLRFPSPTKTMRASHGVAGLSRPFSARRISRAFQSPAADRLTGDGRLANDIPGV